MGLKLQPNYFCEFFFDWGISCFSLVEIPFIRSSLIRCIFKRNRRKKGQCGRFGASKFLFFWQISIHAINTNYLNFLKICKRQCQTRTNPIPSNQYIFILCSSRFCCLSFSSSLSMIYILETGIHKPNTESVCDSIN